MMSGEENSPFGVVPNELLIKIFNHVTFRGKRNGRQVCRRWCWILNSESSFELQFGAVVSNTDNVKTLFNSCLHFESVCLKGISEDLLLAKLDSHKAFPSIPNAKLDRQNSGQNVIYFLKNGAASFESLQLRESSLENVDMKSWTNALAEIKWECLSHLDMRIMADASCTGEINHNFGIASILKSAKLPLLNKLTISVSAKPNQSGDNMRDDMIVKMFAEFHRFLDRHANTLKDLHLELELGRDIISEPIQVNSEKFFEYEKLANSIRLNFKLESLTIRASHLRSLTRLVMPCVWELGTLKCLNWNRHGWIHSDSSLDEGIRNPIETVIDKCRNTLEDIDITSTFPGVPSFDLNYLKNCSVLKKLTLTYFNEISGKDIFLPTVTHLELRLFTYSPGDWDLWIVRNLINIEIIEICDSAMLFGPDDTQSLEVHKLNTLLSLPKLKEIRSSSFQMAPNNINHPLRVFCRNNVGLRYSCANEDIGLTWNWRIIRTNPPTLNSS